MHLIFDLDGTIVDHRDRTYGLHTQYCAARGFAPVPAAEYHARKSAGASERQTVQDSIPPGELDVYMQWKRAHIESDEALVLDTPWPGMLELLARLQDQATLVLLTSRQSESQAIKELQRLGIARSFAAVLAEPSDASPTAKLNALKRYLERVAVDPARVVLIGDTECEIMVAKALGAACLAVTWGIRGEDHLAALGPEGIARSVAELEMLLNVRLGPTKTSSSRSTPSQS